jgi:hypothetical protein
MSVEDKLEQPRKKDSAWAREKLHAKRAMATEESLAKATKPIINAAFDPEKSRNATTWVKGQSGNPAGAASPGYPATRHRNKGVRELLSNAFLNSVLKFWAANGDEALKRTMEVNPAALVATIARLIPKDFAITVNSNVTVQHELSEEQRARIAESWMVSRQDGKLIGGDQGRLIEGHAEVLLPAGESGEEKKPEPEAETKTAPKKKGRPRKAKEVG